MAGASTGVAVGAGLGLLAGIGVDVAVWQGVVPIGSELAALVARPAALLVSWTTGWPLEGESSIACHALGLAITIPAALALLGAVVGALALRR